MTRQRRPVVVVSVTVSVVAVAIGALLVRARDEPRDVSVAASSSTVTCDAGGAPEFLRRIAFEHADQSDPRPVTAEFVKTTRAGAESVASDPAARVPEDEAAYLLQVTGGGFEHPGGQIGGSVSRAPVLSLTVSIAREAVTDGGFSPTPADLSKLGSVGRFSLDPSCAPTAPK